MKLLIVNDDPAVVDFFGQVAETLDAGIVDTADSGEETMARVVNGRYNLITLDIRMPGASGLEILADSKHVSTRDHSTYFGSFSRRQTGSSLPGRHARKAGEARRPVVLDRVRKGDELGARQSEGPGQLH